MSSASLNYCDDERREDLSRSTAAFNSSVLSGQGMQILVEEKPLKNIRI